jgi:hypothetical protein
MSFFLARFWLVVLRAKRFQVESHMAGEYQLAHETVTAFVASSQERGMLRDTLLRCLLNEVVAAYREYRSIKDITHELSFLIDQLNDDVGPITRGS